MYKKILKDNARRFETAGLAKLANDLVEILNDPLSEVPELGRQYDIKRAATRRKPVFDRFCACCDKAGVKTPPMEDALRECITSSADTFFTTRAINNIPGEGTTGDERSVLIVDDLGDEILNTWLAVAGWPTLKFGYHLHDGLCKNKLLGHDKEQKLQEVAEVIIGLKPDIVLMDMNLGDIEGTDLVVAIRDLDPKIHFVGNTGGDPKGFREIGIRGNMDKGKQLNPLRKVLRRML